MSIGRRTLGLAQLTLGLAMVSRPRKVVTAFTPRGSAVPDPRIVQFLGARTAVQGAITVGRPDVTVTSVGALVDLFHALSLVPIIAFSGRYRAAASASAGIALASALTAVALPPEPSPS